MAEYQAPIDTTVFLWDYLFLVRIPQLQTTSVEYLKRHGTYITGDRGIDSEMSNQWITTMLPVSKMVDYYREGVQIRIVKPSDVKEIYEHISNHLALWKGRLEKGINIGDAPIDDLIAMDQFANAIYEHARYQFTQETVNSILTRHISEVGRFNSGNFFTQQPKTVEQEIAENGMIKINAEEPSQYPEREALGDFLKDRLIGLRRWRR